MQAVFFYEHATARLDAAVAYYTPSYILYRKGGEKSIKRKILSLQREIFTL